MTWDEVPLSAVEPASAATLIGKKATLPAGLVAFFMGTCTSPQNSLTVVTSWPVIFCLLCQIQKIVLTTLRHPVAIACNTE